MINQPTPSEIGSIVQHAIEEASAKRQVDKTEAWKVFGTAYEEHKQNHGSGLPLLNLIYSSSDTELVRIMSLQYRKMINDRLEYQLGRLYDYLWFGER